MDLRWDRLDKSAVEDWSRLSNVLGEFDRTGEQYSPDDLAEELDEPDFDPQLDSWAVWSGDQLVAYGQARVTPELSEGRVKTYFNGGVHPDFRGRGIGTALFDRYEERVLARATQVHPGVEVSLRASGGANDSPGETVRPVLERRGYAIARYFHVLERELPGAPLAPVDRPVEVFTQAISESTRLAFNDSFATHWGSTPANEEHWADYVGSRTFRPTTSFVSSNDAGEVDAFCLTNQWNDGELHVNLVGTRQHARGRGLARACLTAMLHEAIAEARYAKVTLGVDATNPDGALGLYDSTGFERVRTYPTYVKLVPSPATVR